MDVNDLTFKKEVLDKSRDIPVLVDFWASWCGPCVMFKPILEKVCGEMKDKVILAKINVEDDQEQASKYDVMSIPSIKLFKDGEVSAEFVGMKSEGDLKEWLDDNL